MKKTIIGTLSAFILLSSFNYTSAISFEDIKTENTENNNVTIFGEKIKNETLKDLIKKYEIVIANNKIEIDREYNTLNYFTKKIDTSKIIIPEELKQKANSIYFLIEEGRNFVFLKENSVSALSSTNEVKNVYNYKKVDYKSGKQYLFATKDLVKELKENENIGVSITLIAEFDNNEKIILSNGEYLFINSKEGILQNLAEKEKKQDFYFSKYNSSDIETYLEKKSEKMSRSSYRKMINTASIKIEKMISGSKDKKETLIKNIRRESDFGKKIKEYEKLDETLNLLKNLYRAVNNQMYNIKTFDAIDSILK